MLAHPVAVAADRHDVAVVDEPIDERHGHVDAPLHAAAECVYQEGREPLRGDCAVLPALDFCRIHETLRVTPAMAAGVSDQVWELYEVAYMLTANRQHVA